MPTPEQHALLSASSAERWLHCPASVKLCENVPDESSPYAEEGRLAHSLGELKLRKHFFPMKKSEFDKAVKAIEKHELYKPEMVWCTDQYVDLVQSIVHGMSPGMFTIWLEQRVDYSKYAPGGFGTTDCAVLHQLVPGDDGVQRWALHIVDYKHGQGVSVSAVDNAQQKLYALGTLLAIQAEDALAELLYGTPPRVIEYVKLHICQPRSSEGSSDFMLTVDELLEWAESEVKAKAYEAIEGNSPPNPGGWCTHGFCRLRTTCRARLIYLYGRAAELLQKGTSHTINNDELAELYQITDEILHWQKSVAATVRKKLNRGEVVRGFKLVRGRSERRWKDEKEVEKGLKTQE